MEKITSIHMSKHTNTPAHMPKVKKEKKKHAFRCFCSFCNLLDVFNRLKLTYLCLLIYRYLTIIIINMCE